jgi:hypothetical protein
MNKTCSENVLCWGKKDKTLWALSHSTCWFIKVKFWWIVMPNMYLPLITYYPGWSVLLFLTEWLTIFYPFFSRLFRSCAANTLCEDGSRCWILIELHADRPPMFVHKVRLCSGGIKLLMQFVRTATPSVTRVGCRKHIRWFCLECQPLGLDNPGPRLCYNCFSLSYFSLHSQIFFVSFAMSTHY